MATNASKDVGWKYGLEVAGTSNHVLCNFCGFVSKAGITRHKHHLAGNDRNVAPCEKVPREVKKLILGGFEKTKAVKDAMKSIPYFDKVVDLEEEDDEEEDEMLARSNGKRPMSSTGSTINSKKAKVNGPLDMHFKPSGLGGKKNGHLVGTPEHKKVQKALRLDFVQKFSRWIYDAGLPFNCVKYESLGPALEACAIHGVDIKPPSYHEVRVPMLKLELEHTDKLLVENVNEKVTYGCSLMADGWRDRRGRALINFLVNTPRGSMFIESVNASSYSHTGEALFELFDRYIQKVGANTVVQIVTDSASNNVKAGKLVEAKYPRIYWTPCAAHCIDLMLEDIFKLSHLKKALERAVAVNNYIYNRTLLLNMMRKFTGQRDLVRPAKTRFATAFLTLSCLRDHKRSLKKMFTSQEWNTSKFATEIGGAQTASTILLSSFWNNVENAVKVGGPLLDVLRLVDGERKPPMGYIYEAMDRAKERIALAFGNKKDKYSAYYKIIDQRWNTQLHQPLHAAGHYLNPSLYYSHSGMEKVEEVMKGLVSCISKLMTEEEELLIHQELPSYRTAQGLFGIPVAKKMRAKISPAEWWVQYGAGAPTLQKFAIKVLSLTCSSSGCERNWSVFEQIHSKKRIRLEQQKLNDLVYIKYNRALRKRYDNRDTIDPIILDDANIQDPCAWFNAALDDRNEPVFEGDDSFLWGYVEDALGADEAPYSTRSMAGRNGAAQDPKTSRVAGKKGASQAPETSTAGGKKGASKRRLVDEEDDYDYGVGVEENDVEAYKLFVVVPEEEKIDEPEYEDLD